MKKTTQKLKSPIAIAVAMLVATSCVQKNKQISEASEDSLQKPVIEWVIIPAGTFTMGNPATEVGRYADETQHQVTLSAFKMSKHEISVGQFKAFVDATGYKTDADKGTGGVSGSAIWTGEKFEFVEG